MIHYHGGPIYPVDCAVTTWLHSHAMISFAYPDQIKVAAMVADSFVLDNGAFSLWKSGKPVNWKRYYRFVDKWRFHPGFDWALIPDVIDGSEQDNDSLLNQWPLPREVGVPVWHLHESLDRLVSLGTKWGRVAIGSSGEYVQIRTDKWWGRMVEVFDELTLDFDGRPRFRVHGLRMQTPDIVTCLPFHSTDGTTVAQNVYRDVNWTGTFQPASKPVRALVLRDRIEWPLPATKYDRKKAVSNAKRGTA